MKIKLENVRLSFPDLFTPRPFKEGDVPKFKATFLIEKDSPQAKRIDAAIAKVAADKWGAKGAAIVTSIKHNPNKFCWQDGDTKVYDGYAGMMALSAGNKVRPLVIDQSRTPLTEQDGKPYAGCYVNAVIEFFPYTNSGNGISASLGGVQFVREGEPFAGGRAAGLDEFDEFDEMESSADDLLG